MACDLRIAAESARLSDWHLKRTGLGIGAWGSAARLSRLVGVDKAKELLLLGEEVSGTEAERIGLVNKSVPDDDLMPEALRWAATIAAGPGAGCGPPWGSCSCRPTCRSRRRCGGRS